MQRPVHSVVKYGFLLWGVGALGLGRPALAADRPGAAAFAKPFPVVPEVEIPPSVFVIPSQAREGRNPFFPGAAIGTPSPKAPASATAFVDGDALVLNGITSPPKPTAMINGRTLAPGEEAELRLPSGAKVRIRLELIKGETAVIRVGDQRRELRLRAGI